MARGNRVWLGFAVLLAVGLLAADQLAPPSDSGLEQALDKIRPEALLAHIRFLADDLLEGRGTGTRGYQLAANYLAAQFEALGLEPAGTRGSYFQPVPLRKADVVPDQSSLILVRGGREKRLEYGNDYVLLPDYLRTETNVAAPVVFVGFGVSAPELNHDDYAAVDVRGKIVVMLYGAPAAFPHNQRAYYSSRSVKRTAALARGAVGLLTFRTPEDEKRFDWARVARMAKLGGMRWLDAKGEPQEVSPQVRGAASLSRSGAEALFAGAPKSLNEVFAAAAGKPPAFDLPVTARIRIVSRHSRLESPNVIAALPGSDPRLRHEYVVYTAHLDHLGIGEPVEGDAIYNGAYDNASGTAALLEIARAFASLPQRPRRSVLFLAVTGEEKGLLGSDYFAHNPAVPRDSLVANVNLDMFLMLWPVQDVVAIGAEHSSLAQAVEQAAARVGWTLSPDPAPEEVMFIRSDQYSFVRHGVPAVTLNEGFQSADPKLDPAALARQWLRTVYHTPQDDAHQPMDLESGVKWAQANFLIGYYVANQTPRPVWNAGDFFGQKFGRPAAAAGSSPRE